MDIRTNLDRLRLPQEGKKIAMVLDTDTYNEVDDQFALLYALLSPERMSVEAVYAAPFHNNNSEGPEDGMEKSYEEILFWLKKMNIKTDGFVFKGSKSYLADEKTPVISDAAKDLAERAMQYTPEEPLYVGALGAITNVASAILINPDIVDRIVVVWLGGHPHYWHTAREFNLFQDVAAARVVFGCGAAVVQIPCMCVAANLITTVAELRHYLGGKNEICDKLITIVEEYKGNPYGWSKIIWDISVIAYLVNPHLVWTELVHTPLLTYDVTWSMRNDSHFMRVGIALNRDAIFADMFKKLASITV